MFLKLDLYIHTVACKQIHAHARGLMQIKRDIHI